jgi:Tol biopolymer transport system component
MWMIAQEMHSIRFRFAIPLLLAIAITMLCAIEVKAQDDDTTYAGCQIVYVSDNQPRGISLVDPVTLERTVLTDREDDWGDFEPYWSPDGTKILFQRGVGDINFYPPQHEAFIMNVDGSGVTQITSIGTLDNQWSPSWAPDGQSIVLTVPYPRAIYRVDIGSGQATRLTPDSAIEHWEQGEGIRYRRGEEGALNIVDYDPVYSPDGQRIAFTSRRDGNSEIYVMNADGSEQTRLTENDAMDYRPQWMNGGQDILFISTRNGGQIYRIGYDGSDLVQLTDVSYRVVVFDVAPDENTIAYFVYNDGSATDLTQGGLYVMQSNGTGVSEVDDNIDPFVDSAWSPDGKQLLVSTNVYAEDLIVYDIDTFNRHRLIVGSQGDWQPVCSATD